MKNWSPKTQPYVLRHSYMARIMAATDCDVSKAAKYSGHDNPAIIANFYYDYSPAEDRADFNLRKVGKKAAKWTEEDWVDGEEQHRPTITPLPFTEAERNFDPEAAEMGRVESMVMAEETF